MTQPQLTDNQFEKCLTALWYLAQIQGNGTDQFWKNDEILVDHLLWVEVNEEIQEILFAILRAFDTTFKPFVVTDDDYNQTFYVDAGYQVGPEFLQDYFPSAREKLECRSWLHQMFLKAGIDTKFIEWTFPKDV